MAINFSALSGKKEEERPVIDGIPGIDLGVTANSSPQQQDAPNTPTAGSIVFNALKRNSIFGRGANDDQLFSRSIPEDAPKFDDQATISAPDFWTTPVSELLRSNLPPALSDALLGSGVDIAKGDEIIPGVKADRNRTDSGAVGFFYEALSKTDQRKYNDLILVLTDEGIDQNRANRIAAGEIPPQEFTPKEKDIMAKQGLQDGLWKALESVDFIPGGAFLTIGGKKLLTDSLQGGAKGRRQADSQSVSSANLITEASKFETADEFVKAQGEIVFHGTPIDFVNKSSAADDIAKSGIRPSSDGTLGSASYVARTSGNAKGFAKRFTEGDATTVELVISPNAKIYKAEIDTPFNTLDELGKLIRQNKGKQNGEKIKALAQDLGYDGVEITGREVAIYNPDVLKTRSQLEDIWQQANQKGSTDLLEEARKYKSADEFVAAQGTPIYRGGALLDESRIRGDGISFTKNKEVADSFLKEYRRTRNRLPSGVEERFISPNARILSKNEIPETFTNRKDTTSDSFFNELAEYSRKEGYDGVDLSAFGKKTDFDRLLEAEIRIVNPKVLKTRSQLEDIWQQAQRNADLGKSTAKTVDNVQQPKVRQMSRSQELPSLLKTAEEEGLFPTQKANVTTESIARKEIELSLREEGLANDPARQLARFANRNGELPEVVGGMGKGRFAREGDSIVTQLGFRSSEEARNAYQKYIAKRADVQELRKSLKQDRDVMRQQNKIMPREFRILTPDQKEKIIEAIDKSKGQTDKIIERLKKKGMTQRDIEEIVLENGEFLVDTVKVKREANGVMSAVITRKDLDEIEKAYRGTDLGQKWKPNRTLLQKGKNFSSDAKDAVLEYYELSQLFFDRTGLRDWFYDPIREARRNASKQTTQIYDRFVEAGLMKRQGWFTADRFNLSKKESERIGRYFLERQGKGGGVNFEDLTDKEMKFVRMVDDIIKETEPRFYQVAKLNGKDPGKVRNYAPIMTSDDFKLAQNTSDLDFIFRKHPSFFSTKQREEYVPFEMYELDYRKVFTRWLDQMVAFNHLGEVGPQVKYLANSDEFKAIVGDDVFRTTNKWVQDIFNPQVLTPAEKTFRFFRQAQSIASLGLNLGSVIKQTLSIIPVTVIEKAPPKLRSKFAKDFGIDVRKLPSITERKGNASIMDMQEGLRKAFVGPLTKADQEIAIPILKGFLDQEYAKALQISKDISPEMQAYILKQAQDRLDLWMGGMTPEQLPRAFRTELGKVMNMFIMPLTSQLNGFIYSVAKASGMKKAQRVSEVLSTVIAIAYMEQVMTNLSPDWSDQETMTKDILSSAAGNIPIVSQLMFAFKNDQPFSPSPLLSAISRLVSQTAKYTNDQATEVDVFFAIGELFGLPKQFRRSVQGVEIIQDGGVRDRNGKLLAPVTGTEEQIRAFLRGRYGTIAAQDYMRNIGVPSVDRRWHIPQVEFLQNGDYDRKAELYRSFDPATQDELYSELSEGQQKKLDKVLSGGSSSSRNSSRSLNDIFGSPANSQDKSLEEIFAN